MNSTEIFEYVGKTPNLQNAVVTIEKETEKSFFINYRPLGGGAY